MGKIIHKEYAFNNGTMSISCPTKEEVEILNKRIESYDHDEMIDFSEWPGSAYKIFFELLEQQAIKDGADPWDYFAVEMAKLHGTMS